MLTTTEYIRALKLIAKPSLGMQQALKAHARAKNQVSTARLLAEKAGYKSWRGINLQYGLLGNRIGMALGKKHENLSLLAEFVRPKEVTNKEWLLLMKPAFAKALQKAKWL